MDVFDLGSGEGKRNSRARTAETFFAGRHKFRTTLGVCYILYVEQWWFHFSMSSGHREGSYAKLLVYRCVLSDVLLVALLCLPPADKCASIQVSLCISKRKQKWVRACFQMCPQNCLETTNSFGLLLFLLTQNLADTRTQRERERERKRERE